MKCKNCGHEVYKSKNNKKGYFHLEGTIGFPRISKECSKFDCWCKNPAPKKEAKK